MQRRASGRRVESGAENAAKMLVHMAAKVNARHGFLPHVTALGVRDRVKLVKICFLRNGGVVDVEAPLGAAGFHPRDLPRVETRWYRTGLAGARPQPVELFRGHNELEPVDPKVRRPGHEHLVPIDLHGHVRIVREGGERRSLHARERGDHVMRIQAEDSEIAQRGALIGVRGQARVDELLHHRRPRRRGTRRGVNENASLLDEHPHVGDDLSLGRERGSVAPLARNESRHIVRHQSSYHLGSFLALDANTPAMASIKERRVRLKHLVFRGDAAVCQHDASSADVAVRCTGCVAAAHGWVARTLTPTIRARSDTDSPSSASTTPSASTATCAGAPTATLRTPAVRAARNADDV